MLVQQSSNCYSVEDVVFKNDVVSGVVVNWTPVLREGLHVDPLNIMSKCVIDGTGHDSEICKVVARKNGIQLDTVTGGVVGESPWMWLKVNAWSLKEHVNLRWTLCLWYGFFSRSRNSKNGSNIWWYVTIWQEGSRFDYR